MIDFGKKEKKKKRAITTGGGKISDVQKTKTKKGARFGRKGEKKRKKLHQPK